MDEDAWLAEQIVSMFEGEDTEATFLDDDVVTRASKGVWASMKAGETVSRVVKAELGGSHRSKWSDEDFVARSDPQTVSVGTSSDSSLPHDEDASEAGEDEVLMAALAGLKRSQPLKMYEAFALLRAVAQDDPRVGLPVRSQASPLVPSRGMYYVVRRKNKGTSNPSGLVGSSSRPKNLRSSPDAVKVAFQSVLNAEAWWHGDIGVVSRPMSRGRRFGAGEPGGEECAPSAGDAHGYRGRMYTLVVRSPGSEGPLPSKRRRLKQDGAEDEAAARFTAVDVSVVHAWRASSEDECCPSDLFTKNALATRAHASTSQSATALHRRDSVLQTDDGRAVPALWCDCASGDVHVRGNLRVDGRIYGQLATEPFAADYAEWFMFDYEYQHAKRKMPRCGSVVQLRSPEQKLSLDTSGPGPVLIISTKPAVAAGVPTAPAIANQGALVAFLGQVPVRCRGRVNCGDQLVPSGDNDGCAVSLEERLRTLVCANTSVRQHKRVDSLGIAMEDSEAAPGDEVTLLCFVRWNHAVRREMGDVVNEAVTGVQSTWQRSLVDLITFIAVAAIILDVSLVVITVFAIQNSNSQPPNYAELTVLAQTIGFTNFCLIILLFVAFARKHHLELQRLRGLVAFWMAAVGIAIAAAAVLAKNDNDKQHLNLRSLIIYFVWKGYNITYNIYICHVMSQFRATRAYSDNVKNLFHSLYRCVANHDPSANASTTRVADDSQREGTKGEVAAHDGSDVGPNSLA